MDSSLDCLNRTSGSADLTGGGSASGGATGVGGLEKTGSLEIIPENCPLDPQVRASVHSSAPQKYFKAKKLADREK